MTLRGIAGGAAVVVLLAAGQANAAWNNAFQVCCHGCRNPASSYYAPAPVVAYSAPNPCCPPPPCCSTSYVQRCYYQPVVSYKTVCEPVTSYKTSHYWEPVCSYRSSNYVDPCTGCCVQVTVPVTSYRLKTKCDAVTSYVQRCVPVTTYRPTYYLEAVTNCTPPPNPCGPTAPGGPGRMGVTENPNADGNYIRPPNVPEGEPQGRPNSIQPPSLKPVVPAPQGFDRITSAPNSGAFVAGQVVANNYVTPMRGAKLLFVSRKSEETKQTAQADAAGRFAVNLPAGGWNIFVGRGDGRLEYHSSIDVQDTQKRNVMVVSR